MSYMNKPFEELDVLDNFLMNAIATDREVGKFSAEKCSLYCCSAKWAKSKLWPNTRCLP